MRFRPHRSSTGAGLIAVAALVASLSAARAESDVPTIDPAPYRHLSCDEIARRIQALNVPISNDNSTIAGFKRTSNPALFFLFGTTSRNAEYKASLADAKGQRNALIRVAVEKNCAAERLVPAR